MNIQRIRVIAHRYLFARFFKLEDLIDFSFWPLLDIITWGGVGLLLVKAGKSPEHVTVSILSASMMRVFTYCYVTHAANFLYEMMARNIINLFAGPLTVNEWFCGAMVSGSLISSALLIFSTCTAWFIFGVYILQSGFGLIVFIPPLLFFAWAVAHISIIILMALGAQAQRLIWVMAWLFVPFSGVYYSLGGMPYWIQWLACGVPMTYIFEALRIFVLEERFSVVNLVYGYSLSIIYFIVTLIAGNLMFERSRQLGLATLERA